MKSLIDYIKGIHTDDVNLSYEDYLKDKIRQSTYVLENDIVIDNIISIFMLK